MALFAINAGQNPTQDLRRHAASLPKSQPLIVMIHGYRFSPRHPRSNPHGHILSLSPDMVGPRVLSWPAALGFGQNGGNGLGIAFGWEARGSLRGAYRRAGQAGRDLARLMADLSEQADKPVAIIGHSMGARVALSALHHAAPGVAGRLILLAGAEFREPALAAIDSPAGQQAEVINITTRENDLFDLGLELCLSLGRRRALGFGLAQARANWLDIQIDSPQVIAALDRLGFPVGGDAKRLCHWSPYLRGGLFDFYRAALHHPQVLPLRGLRAGLSHQPMPRWSRLLAPGGAAQMTGRALEGPA
ncbi:serine aminopeptidase domain-containing protein [Paracoccus jiaweipingae]|uniref:serine aminopeptidase domain-containing protein n=1 Tax=unclassified Paracoccus (in: a-proteobacteria) TaxID=2688777 RepID=UPI00379F2A90